MGENKEYMTHPEELGCIHISEDVLASISAGATAEVEGISGLMSLAAKKSNAKGVRLTVDDDGAVIDLYVMIRYGYAIPEVHDGLFREGGQCPCGRRQFPVSPGARY